MNNSSLYKHSITKNMVECYDPLKPIGVSVHVLCFNHEKTIKRCIDSILKQKVDFNVEIIIHDDHSQDSSLEICLNYSKKYPKFISVISEVENIFSKTNGVLGIEKKLNEKSNGMFIALCESDDYWLDDFKLFKQYHLMISQPKIALCLHKVLVNNIHNGTLSYYPNKKHLGRIIKSKKFINIINKEYSFQTSSYFIKSNYYFDFYNNIPDFAKTMPTNDESWMLFFGSKTDVLYIDDCMSCYNKCLENSWSSKSTPARRKENRNLVIESIKEFNEYTNHHYDKSCKRRIAYNMLMNNINENKFRAILNDRLQARELWRMNKKMYIKKWIKVYVFKK